MPTESQLFSTYLSEKDSPDLPAKTQLQRAIQLLEGLICRQDLTLAREYYKKAISKNPEVSHRELRRLTEDYKVLKDLFKSDTGSKPSFETLLSFRDRNYAIVDLEIGLEYLRRGKTKPKDYELAKVHLEKAAALKNGKALFSLGYIYSNGLGVEKDFSEAIAYYQEACELDNSEAFYNLGYMYELGQGVAQNREKAISLYKKSVDLKNPTAMIKLAQHYIERTPGSEELLSEGVVLLKKAAQLNSPAAFFSLGNLCMKGRGVPQDYEMAFSLYRKAAQKGHSKAAYSIAKMHRDGIGLEKNYSQALRIFERLASLNAPELASYNLPAIVQSLKSKIASEAAPIASESLAGPAMAMPSRKRSPEDLEPSPREAKQPR